MADSYSKWVMTNAFASNSQAALNTGNKIEWVALKTSDDTHALNDLPGFNDTTLATAKIKQTSSINSVVINGNTVTITGLFNSAGNTADYYIKTIFLVAKYNGAEFLAGATVANTSGSAFRMPAASTTEITEFTARPQISVTNSSTISTTVDPVAAATNERVNSLETSLNSKIEDINTDKQKLWNKFADYVTKATAETISGVKTFTQTIVGSITGNAGTATKLQTGRKINGTLFDGTADINVPASNDGDIVHKSGNETVNGDKTFTGNNTFTAPINGALNTRHATFTDFADIAKNMNQYAGIWSVMGYRVNNGPISDTQIYYGTVLVIPRFKYDSDLSAGIICMTLYNLNQTYTISVDNSTLKKWVLLPDDSKLLHNTGDETASGFKNFSGNIATTSENSMINGGGNNGDLAMVKKEGYSAYLALGNSNQSFTVKQSNNNGISPSDTFQDMFTVNVNGTVRAGTQQDLVPLDKNVAHNTGDESLDGIKTFLKKIQGSITNADVADVRTNSISDNQDISKITTSGYYAGRNVNNVQGIPSANFNGKYFDLTVWVYGTNGFAFIVDDNDHMYFRKRQNSVWLDYHSMPIDDTKLVHNSGNETIYDKKTFDAVTTFNNGIVNKPISMNGFKIDVSKLVSGTYNVWQNDISGCPADFGVVEVFENVSNTMYRFTRTDLQDGPHVWVQIKNSFGFSGWKQQM